MSEQANGAEVPPAGEPVALATPLAGVNLVEASAGTGKTWTLSGLFMRLIVEAGLEVDRILAVTYTRAATAELAARIRRRLQDMLDALDGRDVDDSLCVALAGRLADAALARRRVAAALSNLDSASIHTIHGFCQRVLTDRAFASGRSFDVEFADDDLVALQVVEDFWRREVAAPQGQGVATSTHRLLVAHLLKNELLPEQLTRRVLMLAAKHGLRVDAAEAAPEKAALAAYLAERAAFTAEWQAGRAALVAQIAAHPHFRPRAYQARHVGRWVDQVDAHLADGGELPAPPKNLSRFATSAFEEACEGRPLPDHPLIARVEAYQATVIRRDVALQALAGELMARLLAELREERRRRNRERRVAGYDDLVADLAEALAGAGGERLAQSLRERYPGALIDEFQDTDAEQYGIFRRIYGDAPPQALFLVGDPKQAIYSFRGADVFAYIAAAAAAGHGLRLDENRRSVAPLVRAVNLLFAGADPFHLPAIDYQPVRAAGQAHAALADSDAAGAAVLRLRLLVTDGGKPLSKAAARAASAAMAADEIVRLLDDAGLRLGAEQVQGRHIAVLVGTHTQAAAMRRALAERGRACAMVSNASVFETEEAEWLERLLLALEAPQRAGLLAAVLASDLFGLGAQGLLGLREDEAIWERWQLAFMGYQALWRQRGVAVMLRRLMNDHGITERLASHAEGERRLTNLLQLAELAQEAARERPGAAALIQWLAGERRLGRRGDAAQLRLESDENLVRVLTIHGSKGLEFPITFCPFLWDVPSRPGGELFYHDAAAGKLPVVDLGSARSELAAREAAAEALSERLRLAYVALTRASHRCELVWGRASGAGDSALAWLLHRNRGDALPDEAVMRARLDELARASDGAIALLPANTGKFASYGGGGAPPDLAALRLSRSVPQVWRTSSFSSLLHEAGEGWRVEAPDHDLAAVGPPPSLAAGGGRFAFPRGAQAGTCLHAILECIDFTAAPAQWCGEIETALATAGYATHWSEALAGWLSEALNCPLPTAGSLAGLERSRCLREMEFHLPARGAAAELSALLGRHGLAVPPLPGYRLDGFLKGYIDLVFEREGRYHLADYKSNWLGASLADYGQHQLEAAMRQNGYMLQAALYALALHRHLRLRLAGYRYEQHFGGVHYLFLRGMQAQAAATGVYGLRPDAALIDELDSFFPQPQAQR